MASVGRTRWGCFISAASCHCDELVRNKQIFFGRAVETAMVSSPLWTYFCCWNQMGLGLLGVQLKWPHSHHGIATVKMVSAVQQGQFLNLARNPSGKIMNQIPNNFWKENKLCREYQKIPFLPSLWEVGFEPCTDEDWWICWALKTWPCKPIGSFHFFKEITKHHDMRLHDKNLIFSLQNHELKS